MKQHKTTKQEVKNAIFSKLFDFENSIEYKRKHDDEFYSQFFKKRNKVFLG